MKAKVSAPLIAALLIAGLSSCTYSAIDDCAPSDQTLDLVSADYNSAADSFSFPTPLKSETSSFKVLSPTTTTEASESESKLPISEGSVITTKIVAKSGKDGAVLFSDYVANQPRLVMVNETYTPSETLRTALSCATKGERVIAVVPAEEALGQQQAAGFGLGTGDVVVYSFEIFDTALPKADGREKLITHNGLPSISYATTGQPGLTFRGTPAPSELVEVQTKEGTHAQLKSGDIAVVHYTVWNWQSKRVTTSTWDNGVPEFMAVGSNNPVITDSLLVDANIGSQFLQVRTTSDGQSVLVIVVDILGVTQ